MGLRYRKSINLGGGFRVNFSKSGMGYSWGTKGYRVTHKAGGGVRRTSSIPGTGISWVDDSKKGRKRNTNYNRAGQMRQTKQTQPSVVSADGPVLYQSSDADTAQMVNDNTKDFLDAVKKFSGIRLLFLWLLWIGIIFAAAAPAMLILTVCSIVGLIVMHSKYRISVDDDFDEYGSSCVSLMSSAMQAFSSCNKTWQINTVTANSSLKTNAGSAESVTRKQVSFSKKTPFFIKTNATCYYAKLMHSKVFLLPDRMVIKGRKGWGMIKYDDLNLSVENQVFIESQEVPKDADVIGYTWQFVNKNGSPDKRYKNNRQLPKCRYGKVSVSAGQAMSAIFYLSNISKAKEFAENTSELAEKLSELRSASKEMNSLGQNEQYVNEYEDENHSNPCINSHESQTSMGKSATDDETKMKGTNSNSFDNFAPIGLNENEKLLLRAYWDDLLTNSLPTSTSAKRLADGSIQVYYRQQMVGTVTCDGNACSVQYQAGLNGKILEVNGNVDEVKPVTRNWVRFIMNYIAK